MGGRRLGGGVTAVQSWAERTDTDRLTATHGAASWDTSRTHTPADCQQVLQYSTSATMAVRVPPMGETVNHKMLVMTALAAGVICARPVSAQGTVRCTSDSYGTMTTTRCSDGTRSTAERYGSMTTVRDNTGRRATLDTYGGMTTYRDNQGTRGTYDSYGGMTTYRDNRGTRGTFDTYGGTTTYRDNNGTRATYDSYGGTTTGRITTTMPPRSSSSSSSVNRYSPKPLWP